MKVSTGRVEALVWMLIYGGLLVCGLGIALSRGGQGWGPGIAVAGVVAALAGAALIWVRSRMAPGDGA